MMATMMIIVVILLAITKDRKGLKLNSPRQACHIMPSLIPSPRPLSDDKLSLVAPFCSPSAILSPSDQKMTINIFQPIVLFSAQFHKITRTEAILLLFCTLLRRRVELLFNSQGWSANYTQNVQNCQILHCYCFEARALFCQLGMFVSWVFGVRLVSTSLPMRTLFVVFSVSFFLFCVRCVLDQSAEHRVVFWAGLGSARLYVNCLP